MSKIKTSVQFANTFLPCVVFLVLAIRFFGYVRNYAVNIFISDQWDFNEPTLFYPKSLWAIFRWQHGPHRQGLGGLLSVAVDPLFQWNSRDESFVSATLIVLACALAFYLKSRIAGPFSFADILIPLLFLTPVQYETILGATNYALGPIPLILVICFCLAWTLHSRPWKYSLVVLINFLAIYTGFGLFIGFLTPVLLGSEFWFSRRALPEPSKAILLLATVVSLLSIASFFFVDYKMNPAVDCFSPRPDNPIYYSLFAAFMFANFAGIKTRQLVPAVLLGTVLLILVGAILVCIAVRLFRNRQLKSGYAVPAILISYTLLFCAGTAYGRLCLGLGVAQSSRYATYLIPAFFGIYLFAANIGTRSKRLALTVTLFVIALMSSAKANPRDLASMANQCRQRSEWKRCYLLRHDIAACDSLTNARIYPIPSLTNLKEKLDYLEAKHLNLFSDSTAP
jgi:hypothetical protein